MTYTSVAHELIKSRQKKYNDYKDRAMWLLIYAGTFKTKKVTPVFDNIRIDVFGWEKIRVYSDEIPLPDEEFIIKRVMNVLAHSDHFASGKAVSSWAKLLKPI